jgi:hypothetical protein
MIDNKKAFGQITLSLTNSLNNDIFSEILRSEKHDKHA